MQHVPDHIAALINRAAAYALDPDYRAHPHLFKTYRFTDEELKRHRETYQPSKTWAYSNRSCVYVDDDEQGTASTIQRYTAIGWEYKVVPKPVLLDAGWRLTGNSRPVVQAVPNVWRDESTGEVIDKAAARKAKLFIPVPESASDRCLRVCSLLTRCKPTEREFIRYVLKMRNRRGGLLESLKSMLDRWIAYRYPAMRSTDRARKREALRGALYRLGVLHDDQTLTQAFQVIARTTKKDNLADAAKATCVLPLNWRRSSTPLQRLPNANVACVKGIVNIPKVV